MSRSCSDLPVFVSEYFALMDRQPNHFCTHQWELREIVTEVFQHEKLVVDLEQYKHYISLGRYLGFSQGYEWERFIIGLFLCTYDTDDKPRWNRLLVYVGRGAGKDGLISWISLCLISPYNRIPNYNVDIGAVNEAQALRPVADVRKALNSHEKMMKRFFYWTKEMIQGKQNGGELRGYANNSKGLDGLRPGIAILDEIHGYENNDTIEVFKSALGKTEHSRMAFLTTEGYIVDGPLDDMLKLAKKELAQKQTDTKTLWYLGKLDSESEVHDPENWHKANPSLIHKPELMDAIHNAYKDWKNEPGRNVDFICKRMNIKKQRMVDPVTTIEHLKATAKPVPDLAGRDCTVGIDFSKTTDWMAVNAHFKDGDKRYDINHAWICKQSPELWRLKCPYHDWANMGLVTIVDEPEISPDLVAGYISELATRYNVLSISIDSFRHALLSHALEQIGFSHANKNLFMVRNSDIMKVAPLIDRCFALDYFYWGEQPCLRWSTNNTSLIPAKKSTMAKSGEVDIGNFLYGKVEPKARKTDPFMALVMSMTQEEKLQDVADVPDDVCFTFSF